MTRNKKLLRRTGDFIEKHPHKYNQHTWNCGTMMCVAGTAASLVKGYQGFVINHDEVLVNGELYDIGAFAQEQLGLTDDEASILFFSGWEPKGSGSRATRVKNALHKLADGADIEEVTRGY